MPDDLLAAASKFYWNKDRPHIDIPTVMADFARTAIASAVKSERAEIEELRKEVERLRDALTNAYNVLDRECACQSPSVFPEPCRFCRAACAADQALAGESS